jgi:hypothetical protein
MDVIKVGFYVLTGVCSEYCILEFTDVSDSSKCSLFYFYDTRDWGSAFFRDVGGLLADCTVPHTRRECSTRLLFILVLLVQFRHLNQIMKHRLWDLRILTNVTAKVAVFWCVTPYSHSSLFVSPCSLVKSSLLFYRPRGLEHFLIEEGAEFRNLWSNASLIIIFKRASRRISAPSSQIWVRFI